MWNYYSCAGKIMDCLMCFLFYALVLCLCLYDGRDTLWIVLDVVKTFVDQTSVVRDRTMLTTDRRDRWCLLMEQFLVKVILPKSVMSLGNNLNKYSLCLSLASSWLEDSVRLDVNWSGSESDSSLSGSFLECRRFPFELCWLFKLEIYLNIERLICNKNYFKKTCN